ncbi:hypothetical protein Pmani_009921 [Petrolisthes manimaculis]|uniref:Uncharacterized protein n=1 Tax=Petrolisthes manimaculis TaxID=1843537 RepID=A0AAE1Q337_9EUCA|nr:hypothetical protein Pmani_009921 [Petrolisthes manimaculis]
MWDPGSREITPSNENWKDNLTAECYRRCMSMMNGVNPHLLPKVPGCCCDGMMYNYVASPPFAPVYSLSQQLMNHQDFPYKQPYMRPQSRMSDPEDLWRQAEKTSHFYRTEDASVPIRTSYQGINVSLNSMQEATEPVCDYSAFSRYHVRITEETNEHCSIKWKIKVSETEQKEILEKHNTYRQEVSAGDKKILRVKE